MGSLDALIEVQLLDTTADQLRHQRSTLAQLEVLTAATSARAEVAARAEVQRSRLHDLRREQKAFEDEAASVEQKAADIDRKLYDGSVVAHKELEAFQADHRALKARQSELEDRAIEVMEAAEPLEADLAELDQQLVDHDERIARLGAEVDTARAELDRHLAEVAEQRAVAVDGVPAEVVSAYEATRGRMGGIGAARLVGNRCEGCHLEIPSAQLEEVRHAPDDAVVTCPECGRILVR
ncbi:MAG: hypothetical protein JST64_07875 [Actinobacteria bacterium]|nr:hypothetical protein [Actinomycetota bacterium]